MVDRTRSTETSQRACVNRGYADLGSGVCYLPAPIKWGGTAPTARPRTQESSSHVTQQLRTAPRIRLPSSGARSASSDSGHARRPTARSSTRPRPGSKAGFARSSTATRRRRQRRSARTASSPSASRRGRSGSVTAPHRRGSGRGLPRPRERHSRASEAGNGGALRTAPARCTSCPRSAQ